MLAKKKGPGEVKLSAVISKMRLRVHEKTLHRRFWAAGVYLRPIYETPQLDDSDRGRWIP